MTDVQIPSKAVSEGADLKQPVRAMLEDLSLLGTYDDTADASRWRTAVLGPPQSVALIEAGATAAAKGWAGGLGVTILATWASVWRWFGGQEGNIKIATIAGAAIVTAAAVVAIGYLIASDVRGRAAASVATIEARSRVAVTMIRAAEAAYVPTAAAAAPQLIPLPGHIRVRNIAVGSDDESGWLAVAMERHPDGKLMYVVVKGSEEAKVAIGGLIFQTV